MGKRKTRKSQKGGDIGQIIGATALGAVLLLGASQLSRNKTKKPVLNKSIDSKAISSRSLESKAFADRIQAKAVSKAVASRRESKIHPDMRNKVRVFAEKTAKQLNSAKKLNDSQDSQSVISARASSVSKPSSIPKSNNWVTNSEKRIRTPAERRANGMHKESKQKKHKITEAQIQKKKTQKRSRYTSRKRPR